MAQNRIDFEGQGVELNKQAELAWCYAAVISIVSRLLSGAQGWDPCQIVSANLVEKLYLGDAPDQTKDDACNCCQKNEPKVCSESSPSAASARRSPVSTSTSTAGRGFPRAT